MKTDSQKERSELDAFDKRVCDFIRKYTWDNNFSQRAMASSLNIPIASFSSKFNQKRPFSVKELCRFCDYAHIRPDVVLGYVGYRDPEERDAYEMGGLDAVRYIHYHTGGQLDWSRTVGDWEKLRLEQRANILSRSSVPQAGLSKDNDNKPEDSKGADDGQSNN